MALLASLAGMASHAQTDDLSPQVLVMLHLPKAHYRPDSSYAGSYGEGVGLQARRHLAAALAVRHDVQLTGDWPMPLAGVDCFVMRLRADDRRSTEELAKALSAEQGVAWAQPVQHFQAQATRDEPLYPTQPAAQLWHLADLHSLATGRGVRVAVIDSGVADQHPDLAGQVSRNENLVEARPLLGESHGTAVAGIIAARADNGLGIAGIAPQARLLALRACWQGRLAETLCTSLSLAKALQAAVQMGAHIINLSVAGPEDRLLGLLLDQAMARGVTVVAALGNGTGQFPGNHVGVVAVGEGPPLPAGAVQAPGRDIPSTAPGGGWTLVSGSSFATAHVAGLLALMRERHGGASTSRPLATLVTGATGRIDPCASLLGPLNRAERACGGRSTASISE